MTVTTILETQDRLKYMVDDAIGMSGMSALDVTGGPIFRTGTEYWTTSYGGKFCLSP